MSPPLTAQVRWMSKTHATVSTLREQLSQTLQPRLQCSPQPTVKLKWAGYSGYPNSPAMVDTHNTQATVSLPNKPAAKADTLTRATVPPPPPNNPAKADTLTQAAVFHIISPHELGSTHMYCINVIISFAGPARSVGCTVRLVFRRSLV